MTNWNLIESLDIKAKRIDGHREKVPEFGICSSCGHLNIIKTRLFDRYVWCDNYESMPVKIRPNTVDPITECSRHYPIGAMSLRDMSQIAYIIDVKKRQAGFAAEEAEVVITMPNEKGDE
jgi:ssDNA-binding Zn-finger/Zn-ribbon topoisomerase 1